MSKQNKCFMGSTFFDRTWKLLCNKSAFCEKKRPFQQISKNSLKKSFQVLFLSFIEKLFWTPSYESKTVWYLGKFFCFEKIWKLFVRTFVHHQRINKYLDFFFLWGGLFSLQTENEFNFFSSHFSVICKKSLKTKN